MSAPFRGTNYLTVDVFLDAVDCLSPGMSIVYATGDLAHSAAGNPDIMALRQMAWRLSVAKKIALTQRPRADCGFYIAGGRKFEYIATKRREDVKESR
jgi:hypothetical protein